MIPQNVTEANKAFRDKYGIDLSLAEQGSEMWLIAKLGVLSASKAKEILAGEKTATRATYMAELIAQVCTGEMPEISAAALQWGKDNEDAARASYEMVTGKKVQEVGFCFKDNTHRVGFSADGLISPKHGVEIKSPYSSKNYIEFLVSEKVKTEWMSQVQFSLWASGLEKWDLVQFDPRMKKKMVHYITIERDETMMKKFDEVVPKFIKDMDKMLDACGFTFGDQWKRKDVFIEESAS